MPRPYFVQETDILGQSGTAWAVDASVYGDNYYINREQGLVEIYEGGPALSFYHLIPRKNKYEKEGLYLRLKLAYRTSENANVNIRTFSGNHVTLLNSFYGDMYDDPNTYWWVTDDLTININSIFSGEKFWIQRVDWEWMSKEVIYEDEVQDQNTLLNRSFEEIEKLYAAKAITNDSVKNFLMENIKKDDNFAKRCLLLLRQDQLMGEDLSKLFEDSGIEL
ncbi:hypothetical protein VB715_18190 [Crocosphaera sp. UHCC 0190]|uniref:hypothetical protein n=1 Tax=Crocosphaera sp. UHCC 0190 TaxID=3110246 RepID=UPI002B21BC8E|nr:hypothetical protein [Crocosphaera sp. UHCC 0190]MEA5511707.1 hypothetical protein [Crocosphaera sp. UHCC 0190]